ncbi:MAG: hypothetical protein A3C79_03220 [Candidatus Taylorbacteria bacterium RIFCSPHIGHO2_02_FULL_45_28]|uniref:CARDB domain-containing protein n=1 Tax=Candidatus Taylorbacteria bacterium RIFCSPHIGHO2_12_FULL_45_16 TaxID=1802315 RepID=A0A1G2N0R4_9BACT|nr:MAG: hypothetical protein A2830_00940 [Candidatus Taylorbacteria bacterium RIFCSPHIGHO2_01_FULL_44_110]OHA24967.1 MAG: hypothetical protein A3C79_03220 [Candidatus Taylorbacteria bacterium RIFCSPHIGHO2_02_FULL_45_28]OHA29785.1 MAG: hypothetical protein A3F51_03635 [Candidatus Taylorbacteria bacterium RIFCSPHIGHO2_12_FULL_45_16]OHA32729.1 MAG: hypothetical protein A3A23_00505 [Candidatus Taylorbacteria bacterium RIFCSPLOWO2_01_FULL_45_59]OHA39023.1 MAG: hypothetical protein A3I98_00080 [Candi
MKIFHTVAFIGCFILLSGIFSGQLVVSAQTESGQKNIFPAVPPEALAPLGTLLAESSLFDVNSESAGVRADTNNAGLITRVAPGELLPVSVKLSNFGGGTRVDVLLRYGIFSDEEKEIYVATETVAVETTASFVKNLQIPIDTAPGTYVAKTSIIYQGQLVPAATQFSFEVERKIFGIFQSDFWKYGIVILVIVVVLWWLSRTISRHRRTLRTTPFDYSNVPHATRTFYEIISDTIMQMRDRVGDSALIIASNIDGLKIENETGKVLSVTGRPGKIVADLVSEYEKLLGKKVSFSFRKEKTD